MSVNFYDNSNTKAFYNMAWIAFVIATVSMIIGLIYLPADFAMKGFLAIAFLFSLTSCFTVAKVVRDRHESSRFLNKIESAKTERYLSERDPIMDH